MPESLIDKDFTALSEVAIKAVLVAGKVIENYMNEDFIILENKTGDSIASQVLTEVDLKCEQTILSHLLPTCKMYNLGLLTEEQEDDKCRFEKDFFWCIDPIDGTLAFIKRQAGFSVSIALISKDGVPQIGVVYDPTTNNLNHAIKDQGAFKNRKPWKINSSKNYLTYVTDKKLEDTSEKEKIQSIINRKITDLQLKEYQEISDSGAVLNAILVAENTPAIFVKLPKKEKVGGSIWDYAATACIFNELELHVSDFYGNPLEFNSIKSTYMNEKGVFYKSF